jgi:hypothetical protein
MNDASVLRTLNAFLQQKYYPGVRAWDFTGKALITVAGKNIEVDMAQFKTHPGMALEKLCERIDDAIVASIELDTDS